jgi:hypothetical protein
LRSPTLQSAEATHKGRFAVRRIYRKLARNKGSGSLCRITVFVSHENVLRLLEFLGYRLE